MERVEAMIAQNGDRRPRRATGGRIGPALAVVVMATAAGMVSSASAPVRLVGVSVQGDAVLIESTEPVAYSVDRPDPLTLVVDMRNVSIADAQNNATPRGAIAGVRLEQASAVDGRAVARVRLSLSRPSEYKIRSARNIIRVELSSGALTAPPPGGQAASASAPARQPRAGVLPAADGVHGATAYIERIRTSRSDDSTTVTISGDGVLTPARVAESEDAPRRLVLDFPGVASKAPSSTDVNTALVRKIRVGVNSQEPLVTRVVMEIADAATYHVERAGTDGRDLAVVFAPPQASGKVLLTPLDVPGAGLGPDAPISLEQAIRNAAPITPQMAVAPAAPPDPIAALDRQAAPERKPEPVERPASEPVERERPRQPDSAAPPRGSEPVVQATRQGASQPLVAPPVTREQRPAVEQPSAPAAPLPQPEKPVPVSTQPPAPAQAPGRTAQAPSEPAATPPAQPVSQPPAAAQSAGSAAGQQQVSGQPEKRYTGNPISMDFQGVDLRAVLRAFAEPSGLNFIIDPDVQGSVDMVLTDVPWDQALEVILRANQLDYTVDGTIVRIARIETLKRENDARQALAKSAADAGTLSVRTFSLSYARAASAAPLIKKAALSPRGDVQIDERTNTLIVTDLPARLDMAANLLATLDRAEPQVEVEARIVQTTRDFARAIGVQWGLNGRMSPEIGNTSNFPFPNRGSIGGRVGGQQGATGTDPRANPNDNTGTAVDLGVDAPSSAIGLALGAVNGAFNLDVALSALESSGKGRVLSNPRLTTQNNIQAEVSQGLQIPIQTVANNTVTVTFKDAVLILRVTPQITAANTVIMKVEIENAAADFSREVGGIPPIDTQRANTQVQVDDGATTVIGGIFISREQSSIDRTPVLHRIPLIGWLFRRDSSSDESRELLIFITPRILRA